MIKRFMALVLTSVILTSTSSCYSSSSDTNATLKAANNLAYNQPTPTDIDYSLERYNLIRTAFMG